LRNLRDTYVTPIAGHGWVHFLSLHAKKIYEGFKTGRICTFYFKCWLIYIHPHTYTTTIPPQNLPSKR
jgi:hypothetical protein